jgi:spore coat protein H
MAIITHSPILPAHPILLAILLLSLLFSSSTGFSQGELEFIPKPTSSINSIAFTIAQKKMNEIHDSKGSKINFTIGEVLINNTPAQVDRFRIRGSSSSQYYRKSFNIRLQKKVSLFEKDTVSTKSLYAISMNMDRNYIRNKIAYTVLQSQGIVVPPHGYATLIANGKSEGLYMMFYPPADYATKVLHSPVVIRRGYNSAIKKTYSRNIPSEEVKALNQKFISIYKKNIPKYKGEELYAQLTDVLDLEGYFTWMAFNDLFNNGDYSDEAYFMWNTSTNRFELIPWDFDDLFQMTPHETLPGTTKKKFIFSVEDKLDATIANDPVLYSYYLKTYNQFLNNFSKEKFKEILEKTYTEVSPYFLSAEIMEPSKHDKYGKTDIQTLQTDLNNIYMNISLRMQFNKKELESKK